MSFLNTASSNIQPLGLVVVAFVFFFSDFLLFSFSRVI